MARYHSSAKVPEPQVRDARRLIVYFRKDIEGRKRGFCLASLRVKPPA